MFSFVKKLKAVKNELKPWAKSTFRHVQEKLQQNLDKLITLRPSSLIIQQAIDSTIGLTDLSSKGKNCCFSTKNIGGVWHGRNG